MNIGEFQVRNGRRVGHIATKDVDLPRLGLRPIESDNDKAPIYEIIALNVGNRWVQIGALWEAVAKHTTGEIFLQGTIDDPSLAEPLPIALFGNDEEGYRVAWRRPQRRDDFGPVVHNSRRDYQDPNEGGFGDSTADQQGSLVSAGGPDDDDNPF